MKTILGSLSILLVSIASISYFKYERTVNSVSSSGQYYADVDQSIFQHSRTDLDDLRIYFGSAEFPYKLTTESGGTRVEQKDLRVLQPGTVAGKTQFILDMSGLAEYNLVTLK